MHTHVHSPENGEELIPEANLFCSNPAAVTGSPQVLGTGAVADHIAFMPSPSASLSHSPVAGGGKGRGIAPSACLPQHRARGVYGGNEQKTWREQIAEPRHETTPTHRLPLFNEVPPHPPPRQAPHALTSSCLSPLSAEMLIHRARHRRRLGGRESSTTPPDLPGRLHTADWRQRSGCTLIRAALIPAPLSQRLPRLSAR